jgi:predicted metal-binding protein
VTGSPAHGPGPPVTRDGSLTIHETPDPRPDGVELLVCMTCRQAGVDTPPDERREGALLHEALAAGALPEGVTLRAVECLSNCTRGCSVALRGPGRWTYVYGNLAAADAEVVLDGAARYHATADGLVPWRERPEHFRKNCIARVPPLEVTANV